MMTPEQLRAAATRARAARQPVRLLPGDAEALADELDRLVGVLDNERCDAEFWKERAAAAHASIRHTGSATVTCGCYTCSAAIREARQDRP